MSHVKCQGNKTAHFLVKFAKEIEENSSLVESAIAHNVLNLFSS